MLPSWSSSQSAAGDVNVMIIMHHSSVATTQTVYTLALLNDLLVQAEVHIMYRQRAAGLFVLGCSILLAPTAAQAGLFRGRACCTPYQAACATVATVKSDCGCDSACGERTVLVPEWTTETRTVKCTEYQNEKRERTVTVYKNVPETVEKTRKYTVMVPEKRTKTVNYTVRKPVYETKTRECKVRVPEWKTVEQTYTVNVPYTEHVEKTYTVRVPEWNEVEKQFTVMVPHVETREGFRTVTRCVPETTTKTVTRDCGHWETETVEVSCNSRGKCCSGGCGPATRTVCRRVWVPNVVTKEVPCTVYRTVHEKVPCTYTRTVCKPETRTRMVSRLFLSHGRADLLGARRALQAKRMHTQDPRL